MLWQRQHCTCHPAHHPPSAALAHTHTPPKREKKMQKKMCKAETAMRPCPCQLVSCRRAGCQPHVCLGVSCHAPALNPHRPQPLGTNHCSQARQTDLGRDSGKRKHMRLTAAAGLAPRPRRRARFFHAPQHVGWVAPRRAEAPCLRPSGT